jgi:hypothetical protein
MKKIGYLLISGYTFFICAIYPSGGRADKPPLFPSVSCTTFTAEEHASKLVKAHSTRDEKGDFDRIDKKIRACLSVEDPSSIKNYYCELKARLRSQPKLANNYHTSKSIPCQ